MKEKKKSRVLLVVFFAILGITLILVLRKIYWNKRFKEEREKIEELRKKAKEFAKKQHANHERAGIKYHKDCSICKGDWK